MPEALEHPSLQPPHRDSGPYSTCFLRISALKTYARPLTHDWLRDVAAGQSDDPGVHEIRHESVIAFLTLLDSFPPSHAIPATPRRLHSPSARYT